MKLHLPPDGILRALTVKEPFASLLVGGVKLIENRTWHIPKQYKTPMTIAIHSSLTNFEAANDLQFCYEHDPNGIIDQSLSDPNWNPGTPGKCYFYGGAIVGLVDIVGSFDVTTFDDDDINLETQKIAEHYAANGIENASDYAEWSIGPICWIVTNARRFKQGIASPGALNLWKLSPAMQSQVVKHSQDLLSFPALPDIPIGKKPSMQLNKVRIER